MTKKAEQTNGGQCGVMSWLEESKLFGKKKVQIFNKLFNERQ